METKRSDVEEWKKKKKRKRVTMKQKNLFELWGLKDPHPKPPDPDDVQQSRAAAASPLNCPFYKKIPGRSLSFYSSFSLLSIFPSLTSK